MTKTRDKDRVLNLLHARGEAGVSPVDFAAPGVVDCGKPIMRVAARIKDLRNDGHEITTTLVDHVALYRLVGVEQAPGTGATSPGVSVATPPVPAELDQPSLFDQVAA